MSRPTVEIRPDLETLTESLADWIVERYAESTGPFALNLSGGSTPKRLYEILGSDIIRTKIDWKRVHIFFGDERFVPKGQSEQQFRHGPQGAPFAGPDPRGERACGFDREHDA